MIVPGREDRGEEPDGKGSLSANRVISQSPRELASPRRAAPPTPTPAPRPLGHLQEMELIWAPRSLRFSRDPGHPAPHCALAIPGAWVAPSGPPPLGGTPPSPGRQAVQGPHSCSEEISLGVKASAIPLPGTSRHPRPPVSPCISAQLPAKGQPPAGL